MDWTTIIGYVLSGCVALVVAQIQHNKTVALLEYRLEQLEKKMDIHNNAVMRLTVVEEKVKQLEQE